MLRLRCDFIFHFYLFQKRSCHYGIVLAQLVGFSTLCHQTDVVPSLMLFSCFFWLRKASQDQYLYMLQKTFGFELFLTLPNKINRFKGRWLVIEPSPDWDAPMSWNHNNASHGFSPFKDVQVVYRHLVEMLIAYGPVSLLSLLRLENFRAAGWGVVMPIALPLSSALFNQGMARVVEDEMEMPG